MTREFARGDRVVVGRRGTGRYVEPASDAENALVVLDEGVVDGLSLTEPLAGSWSLDDVFEVTAAVLRREGEGEEGADGA